MGYYNRSSLNNFGYKVTLFDDDNLNHNIMSDNDSFMRLLNEFFEEDKKSAPHPGTVEPPKNRDDELRMNAMNYHRGITSQVRDMSPAEKELQKVCTTLNEVRSQLNDALNERDKLIEMYYIEKNKAMKFEDELEKLRTPPKPPVWKALLDGIIDWLND